MSLPEYTTTYVWMIAPKIVADDGRLYRITLKELRYATYPERYPVLQRMDALSVSRYGWVDVKSLEWSECDATLDAMRSTNYAQPT